MKFKMANGSRRMLFFLCISSLNLNLASFKSKESQAASGLTLITDKSGGYQVQVRGQTWLASSPAFITAAGKRYSAADGSLNLVSVTQETGEDVLGTWSSQVFQYRPVSLSSTVQLIFKQYKGIPAVFFGQNFLDGLNGTSTGDANAVSTGFPSFLIGKGDGPKLGYVAYGGIMVGDTHRSQGIWGNSTIKGATSGLDSGPLVLFNGKGDTLVISSFAEFMAVSAQYSMSGGQATASWGVLGAASSLPKDFNPWTVLYYSNEGVNTAMSEWGKMMRKYYNKGAEFMLSDFSNNYIGYWTDNGAYYYYLTETGQTYEQTILDVKTYADKLQIPYRYVQYDSWWYYKGPNNGVTEWISRPDVFPNGMFSLFNRTGWPVVAHNRWWSHKTVYAKQNGGMYDFIVEEANKRAMPIDQEFWDFIMQSSKKWGLITYEQDWLNTEFDTMDITVSDVKIGRQWLKQMGNAAQKSGVTVQYCMSPSRHILESLEIPVVTQARVSNDYHPGQMQWKIGVSSLLADALGVAPFKDNFWTTTHQPGNKYNATEPYPELNSLVSTLSTGPVGPSDMVGASNVELIMRSCNADGLILKPSKPATAIDNIIYENSFGSYMGELWSTYSDISGNRFGIIMGADLKGSRPVGPTAAGFGKLSHDAVVFKRESPSSVAPFSDKFPLTVSQCGMEKGAFCLYYTSPVISLGFHTIVLLGELQKWVPMSVQRLRQISITSDNINIDITGGSGEQLTFSYLVDDEMSAINCVLSAAGTAKLSIKSNRCYSL